MTKDHEARFWDKIAQRYSTKPVADEASYQEKLRVTREYFRRDMEVLEIGCGTGSTAIAHAPFVKHIRATDISSQMIEIARHKAEADNIVNLTFEVAAVEALTIADRSLDAVLALSLLHLLADKDAVIAKVHAMLKPGGLFVTSTPCLADGMKWFRYVEPIGRALRIWPMVNVFTVSELAGSLARARFDVDYQWQPGKNKAVFIVAKKRS